MNPGTAEALEIISGHVIDARCPNSVEQVCHHGAERTGRQDGLHVFSRLGMRELFEHGSSVDESREYRNRGKVARQPQLLYDTHHMIETTGEAIWKITGMSKGPHMVIFGGVHGNELTGIEVVKKIREAIVSGDIVIDRGTLHLILGNPRAIERNTRGSADHVDLNRCFKKDVLDQQDELYERQRAKEIAQILATADISIDLHAMNKPSVPFLCCAVTEAHEKIYQWLDCDRVLADPNYILGGESVTTDEYIDLCGGVGICYETGMAKDLNRIDEVMTDVLNILKDQQMILSDALPTKKNTDARSIYELVHAINLTEAGFQYADGRGAGSFEEFRMGDVIGYVGEDPLIAEFDGVIVFPKIPELQKLGKPLVYLAKRIK